MSGASGYDRRTRDGLSLDGLSPDRRGAGSITVLGGRGGFAASVDDLLAAIPSLRECSDLIFQISHRTRCLDVLTGPITRAAPVDALARLDWHQSEAVNDLWRLAYGLDRHTWQTRQAVTSYQLADWEAAAQLAVARAGVPLLLRERQRIQPLGLLRDGRVGPVEPVPVDPESVVQLWDLASIVTSQSLVSGESTVRVIEQMRPDGGSAWVVQIPGTASWSPRAGEVPNDLTADLQLMARDQAALTDGVVAALAAAQRAAGRSDLGDPVMLTGHSLGGLAAASIASDPAARAQFRITHVVTLGAPVGYLPVPDDVEMLSLEHTGDIVPGLDLATNPDRETWTTVHRHTSLGEHGAITYRETARLAAAAIEEGSEPSLTRWAATAAPFLRAPPGRVDDSMREPSRSKQEQRVRDYRVRREREREGAG